MDPSDDRSESYGFSDWERDAAGRGATRITKSHSSPILDFLLYLSNLSSRYRMYHKGGPARDVASRRIPSRGLFFALFLPAGGRSDRWSTSVNIIVARGGIGEERRHAREAHRARHRRRVSRWRKMSERTDSSNRAGRRLFSFEERERERERERESLYYI